MAGIRSTNTKAEKTVFSYLRKEKVYFQKHYRRIIGTPDIALPRKKKAVFIDGDFWHGRFVDKIPDSDFWRNKISSNMQRDKKVNVTLSEMGWRYMRVWESEIKRKSSAEKALKSIKQFLID